ncbi:MAG: MvdC/MvdD family ATP grasp protein, partial [Pseudonocardiaceae bacterium]
MPGTVLVLTEQFDVTADHVVTELADRGTRVVRFDTSEFPRNLVATARLDRDRSGVIRTRTHVTDLGDVGAVYY